MPGTLAFDVYGTLINTHGIVSMLENMVGTAAESFSQTWRDKQLEYTFRRGLMQNYQNFAVCTSHALDYACQHHETPLSVEQKQALIDGYRTLPAFADVAEGLARLNAAQYRLYAFSNGGAEAVDALLAAAGIRDHFAGIVSVDDLRSFKPNPAVYRHFLRQSGASGSNAWLISSNPFDVIGSISAGMRAAWVKRSKNSIFDPWGIEPTLTVTSIGELVEKISRWNPKPTVGKSVSPAINREDLLQVLRSLEIALHQPGVRCDVARLSELLHASFYEIGRSGRCYTRADILRELPLEAPPAAIHSQDYRVFEIGDGIALLTYKSAEKNADGKLSRHTLRSSVWLREDGGWKIRFHQGTPAGEFLAEES